VHFLSVLPSFLFAVKKLLIGPWVNPPPPPAHWDHQENPPKPIQMAISGPKNYRFGFRDPDFVYGNDVFNI
jgi:hypothetical protein